MVSPRRLSQRLHRWRGIATMRCGTCWYARHSGASLPDPWYGRPPRVCEDGEASSVLTAPESREASRGYQRLSIQVVSAAARETRRADAMSAITSARPNGGRERQRTLGTRTLPLRIAPGDGEAIDSWLEANRDQKRYADRAARGSRLNISGRTTSAHRRTRVCADKQAADASTVGPDPNVAGTRGFKAG